MTIYNLLPPTSRQYMEGAGGFEILVPTYQIKQCHSRRMLWKSVSYGDPPYQAQPVTYHHMTMPKYSYDCNKLQGIE